VIFQRYLWHIPHEFKWYLGKNRVKSKSSPWVYAMAELLEIFALRDLVDDLKVIRQMVASKEKRLSELIGYWRQRGLE